MSEHESKNFSSVGYQYWPARREVGTEEWEMLGGTNRARQTEPYATPYGANYRIALEKVRPRWWDRDKEFEYKVLKRPFGEWEDA